MWEIERSPALAAPGSNDFTGLIASTTVQTSGANARKVRALSEADANDLCERYRPLAFKIAGEYRNRGVELDDLRSEGLLGLARSGPENRSDTAAHLRSVASLPVAVVAVTFVRTRPDAEIAIRISAEVPVIWAIKVGTRSGAIAQLGTCLTIPPPSVTGVLDGSDIIYAEALATRLRAGWNRKDY